jgi:hypothetical protein
VWLDELRRDIRYSVRSLHRAPGFAAVAILSLALAIGANTAIFSVSWVLFSEPLAVQNPDGLLAVTNRLPRDLRGIGNINGSTYRDPVSGTNYRATLSYPAYLALRDAAGADADLFAYSFLREANIGVDGWSTTGAVTLASGNYFRGAGVAIPLGRALTDDDDHLGASAAVISYRFWNSALGGDPGALGKSVRVNGVPFTIVGVSGPGFVGMSRAAASSRRWTSPFLCVRCPRSALRGRRPANRCSPVMPCSGFTRWLEFTREHRLRRLRPN